MNNIDEIYSNVEKWENGELGNSEKHAKVSTFTVADLQKSIELQAISLRINKDLLIDLKELAKMYGIGYQPLIKQILRRFVDAEKRRLANEYLSELNAMHEENKPIDKSKRKVG